MTSSGDPNQELDPANTARLVHEARKAIKRMRALARLQREEIGEQEFQRVNSLLRDAAQRLAGARDAEVRLATLSKLTNRHPKALALEGIRQLHAQLESDRARATTATSGSVAQGRVVDDLAHMRRELSRWTALDHDFNALAPGLQRIYSEGRRRYERVKRKRASPRDLHDWRKRVKALYYALDMLGSANTRDLRGLTKRAERLGEALGEEHDLWMLSIYVQAHPDALGDSDSARAVLFKLVERRRRCLLKRALAGGARVYADSPAKFTRCAGEALSR